VYDSSVASDELLIVINKSDELLNLFDVFWLRPLKDHVYLILVYVDPLHGYPMS
jgi:hypothetical protein